MTLERLQNCCDLSIHDLTRRSTTALPVLSRRFSSFNSRPHKEVDGDEFSVATEEIIFQFTTSQGGRQPFGGENMQELAFQFTTSQGGRHCQGVIR